MKRYFREWSVLIALAVLLVVLGIMAPAFFEAQPLLSRVTRTAPVLLVACGMALVIIARQIDISVGSQFAVCSVCAGLMAESGWTMPAVFGGAILAGVCLGAVNGALVAGLRLPSIVVTLAMMVILREGLRWFRQGEFLNLPYELQWFGMPQFAGQAVLTLLSVMILVVMAIAMRQTAAGRFVYAVGSDAEAARLAGIRPRWVTFLVFVLLGALVGIAAMMGVVQSPQVDPKAGTGLELAAIAAVVVGGVAISGGRGNLWGVFAGVLLLACVSPALIYLRVEAHWERAIEGGVILLAVIADGVRGRRERF